MLCGELETLKDKTEIKVLNDTQEKNGVYLYGLACNLTNPKNIIQCLSFYCSETEKPTQSQLFLVTSFGSKTPPTDSPLTVQEKVGDIYLPAQRIDFLYLTGPQGDDNCEGAFCGLGCYYEDGYLGRIPSASWQYEPNTAYITPLEVLLDINGTIRDVNTLLDANDHYNDERIMNDHVATLFSDGNQLKLQVGTASNSELATTDTQTDLAIAKISDYSPITGDGHPVCVLTCRNSAFMGYRLSTTAPISETAKVYFLPLTTRTIDSLAQRLTFGEPQAIYSNYSDTEDAMAQVLMVKQPGKLTTLFHYNAQNKAIIDFNGAFSPYLWETFFHSVYLIAKRFNQQGEYGKARDWLHFIFNPTKGISKDSSFIFPPFKTEAMSLEGLYILLNDTRVLDIYHSGSADVHAIAKLRPIVYMKALVMFYVKNLMDWGDACFRTYTRESLAQALNLYIMVEDLLGAKPEIVKREAADAQCSTFKDYLDGLKNSTLSASLMMPDGEILVWLEDQYNKYFKGKTGSEIDKAIFPYNNFHTYFGIPSNKDFWQYWQTIADRLFNIRHCMTLEGAKKIVNLFAPPIDPYALVRAAGTPGCNIVKAVLAERSIPVFRFQFLLEKAKEFTREATNLADKALISLEKQESSQLTSLLMNQQSSLLKLAQNMHQWRLNEVVEQGNVLQKRQAELQQQCDYYQGLIDGGLNIGEVLDLTLRTGALIPMYIAANLNAAGAISFLLPELGSPFAIQFGGSQLGGALTAGAGAASNAAEILQTSASLAATGAGYSRRMEEWKQQKSVAEKQLETLKSEVAANNAAQQIVLEEFKQWQLQVKQVEAVQQYYVDRVVGTQFYSWLVDQYLGLAQQVFKMAQDIAASTERACRYELSGYSVPEDHFITGVGFFANHGQLAGETLMGQLMQMEQFYLQTKEKEVIIEKNFSVKQLLGVPADVSLSEFLQKNPNKAFDFTSAKAELSSGGFGNYKVLSVQGSVLALLAPYDNVYFVLTQTDNKGGKSGEKSVIQSGGGESRTRFFGGRDSVTQYATFEGVSIDSTWTVGMGSVSDKYNNVDDIILNVEISARPGVINYSNLPGPVFGGEIVDR